MTFNGVRVLVTGATGFLGGTLALKLAAEGARVRALVRTPSKAGFLRGIPKVELVPGDVTDRDSLTKAVDGCAVVFHCAASFTDWRSQQAVNVGGTRNVAETAAEAKVERLVHVSTIAVYGYRPTGDITESAPMVEARGDPYNLTKIQAEREVVTIATTRNLSYTLLRPGQIYGPRGGMWTQSMFQLARRRWVFFPGDGSGSVHAIHVDDVADLALVLATHPGAHDEAFNCSPDPAPTWRDFLGGYRRLAGRGENGWAALPVAPILAGTKLAAMFAPAHSNLRDAPDLFRMMQRRFSFSTAKARDRLGWTPKVSLSDGSESCAPWLRAQGLLR